MNQACDAPSFDLGLDSPEKDENMGLNNASNLPQSVITPVNLDSERFNYDDDWDDQTWREAVSAVERVEREKGIQETVVSEQADTGFDTQADTGTEAAVNSGASASIAAAERPQVQGTSPVVREHPDAGLNTPARAGIGATFNTDASGSTTAAERPQVQGRRIVRQGPCMKSPYFSYVDKRVFTCSTEVKDTYNAVTAHGKRAGRGQDVDKTPIIVSYDKFFVSLRDLANSMLPGGWVSNTVMELGIESIMLRKLKKIKKLVMPLRVSVNILHTTSF